MTRASSVLATLAFLAGVPLTIWLAFHGHDLGYYSYNAVPIAFGVFFAVGIVVLFVVLTALRRFETR